ncbi:MAG: NfeD family protein [Armatimonadota bacterium]|nr:NfeD family protein [Armatimonadota bacterium]
MSLAALLEWWNFIFALPLVVGGLLLLGLALSGLIDLSEPDDTSHHAEAHAEVAADTAHAESAHGDTYSSADASVVKTPYTSPEHHHELEKPLWLKFLNLFGIGMGLPISMALPFLMMVWGVVGLVSNSMLAPLLKLPALYTPISVAIALVTMAMMGRTAGLVVRRLLRNEAPQVVDKYGLVGATGRAVYEITAEGGVAHVRDPYGNLHRIVCRTAPNEPNIPANTPILVVRYDEASHMYWVERNPLELHESAHEVHSSAHQTQHIGGQ